MQWIAFQDFKCKTQGLDERMLDQKHFRCPLPLDIAIVLICVL